MAGEPFDLESTYIDVAGDSATPLDVTETFWQDLASGAQALHGWLMMRMSMTADFPHWEMHPRGEEIFHLVSGEIEVTLEKDGDERRVTMRAGDTFIIPRGAWHWAAVKEPAELIVLTYGEGTEHRAF